MNKIFKTKFRSFNGETCSVAVSEKASCRCKTSSKGLSLHVSSISFVLKSLSVAVISVLAMGVVFVPSNLSAWTQPDREFVSEKDGTVENLGITAVEVGQAGYERYIFKISDVTNTSFKNIIQY